MVVVPASQLSLAIGNGGQNAKLAAKLTGYKIDIKPDDDDEAIEEMKKAEEMMKIDENEDDMFEADSAEEKTETAENSEEIIADETAEKEDETIDLGDEE